MAKNPSPMPSPPNGTNPPVTTSVPLCDGTHATDLSMAEPVPVIVHSQHSVAAARSLWGREAQRFIDFIDRVTAAPELNEKLRKQCLHLLYKICKDREILPVSYLLQQELIRADTLHRCGGFADVSEGEYMGRRVAIKDLRFGTRDASNRIFKKFCREIIVWRHISHPNILPLLGVSFSTCPYSFRMVSPWMKNGNVVEYTRSNPSANRLQLLSGIMSGTSYLHGLGIVHGDLKGANILVDDDGTALLADFGLATISVDLDSIPLSATTISSAGTERWMSPELLFEKDCPPTQESDRYALGMVIYEVLSGFCPFHHLGRYSVLIAVREGEHPERPPHAESPGFSDRLWELTLQCWDRSPPARPTAQELLRCLQDTPHTKAPSLEHTASDGLGEETGPDFILGDGRSAVVGVLKSCLFVLGAAMLYFLSFSCN